MRHAPLVAILATIALAACSHGGDRHFSVVEPGPTPTPPPTPAPPTPPEPGPPAPGPLAKTVDTTTSLAGGLLHVGGNIVLGVADQTNLPLDHLGATVVALGDHVSEGPEGIPLVGGVLDKTVTGADTHLAGVAQVSVVGMEAQQSTNAALGVSLGGPSVSGSIASTTLLGPGATQLADVSLGGAQVLGNEGQPAAVKVGLLNGPAPGATSSGGAPQSPSNNPLSQLLGGVGGLFGN